MSPCTSILLRLVLLFHCLSIWNLGVLQEDSAIYGMVMGADWLCVASLQAILPLTVLGLIDILINDIFPDRFVLPRALKNRHTLNMVLSLCMGVLLFYAIFTNYEISSVPYLLVQAIFLPLAAINDVIIRYKKPQYSTLERLENG